MFRHKGKSRTFKHNARLAALLSFIAGLVNISGVLHVKTLTTNVTGHFAFFAEELVLKHYTVAVLFLLYILAFLAGSFFSSLLTEFFIWKGKKAPHTTSIVVEICLLVAVGLTGFASGINLDGIAFILLFAMGMQNSLVTLISNARVRTTHLTGLFTDLGIELSQLFFFRKTDQQKALLKSIELRLVIISFFFAGCISGGFLFNQIGIKTLLLAGIFLTAALFYDVVRLAYFKSIRRKRQ